MQIPVPRRFVTDLTDTENVDQVFIAILPTKNSFAPTEMATCTYRFA